MWSSHEGPINPHVKPADLDEVNPAVQQIIIRMAEIARDPKFMWDHGLDAVGWSQVFRNKLPECCAFHKVMAIREISLELRVVLQQCTQGDCPLDLTHDFLGELMLAIDTPMAKMVKDVYVRQMLEERVN